jgi:ribosomal protein L11 methyltransferase
VSLYRATLVVPREQEEVAVARLLELFPAGAQIEYRQGGTVAVSAYLPADELARVREEVPDATLTPVDEGWEDAWRRFHVPVAIGPLWVGPPWETPPPALDAVVIDPGRAFGTGAHETTRLCVELLLDLPPASLLDIGCGSGVLAIAAAKLGYGPVQAVDVEQASVEATTENARVNGVDVEAWCADALVDELPPAGVVVANILLGAVEAVAPRVSCERLVTSGYLRADRPLLPGYAHLARREHERWAADLWKPL